MAAKGDSDNKKPAKKEVVSLIDDNGETLKPKRRRKAEPEKPAEPEKKAPAAKKKAASLDLFSDQEKKATRKKTRIKDGTAEAILPPISVLQAEKEQARDLRKAALTKHLKKEEPEEPAKEEPKDTSEDAESTDGEEASDEKVIHLKPPIMIEELAGLMGMKGFKLIKDLMEIGVFASVKGSIEPDVASQICEKHGFVFEREKREKGGGVHKVEEVIEEPPEPEAVEEVDEETPRRPPIITFMGHVDHGKTSLLDAIRETKITAGEAGGITQHIGAYSVERNGNELTLLDTPGHAAFAQMRARGANVTDIVVLVVAADDGLMPQTIEAISHAKAAGVTIVVAINKIDLPGSNPMRVKTQLAEQELNPTDLGGEIECIEVSAQTGDGIDDLIETLVIQAEVLELSCNLTGPARAIVVESRLEAGRGASASVIVRSGTLKIGAPFICGPFYGKVKSMINDRGERVKEATPATPVELLGFSDSPMVGDEMVEMKTEREAKKLSEDRHHERRQEKLSIPQRANLKDFMASMDEASKKTLNIILKTDVAGTAEAIVNSLTEIKSEKVRVKVLHSAAGAISESDVLLASASDAIIIGFNTKVDNQAVSVVKREGVEVKLYSIIYELLDQIEDAMLGLLDPETRERVVGHAEVKVLFKLSRGGRVGGCVVTDGKMIRKARARVVRGGVPIYDGGFATLRRFKDDVKEVKNGLECGIKLGDFTDYQEGDVIECYELDAIDQTL